MNDYIDRQAALDKINERQRKLIYCFGFENDAVKIMDIAKSIIIAIPAADVVPVVHARWENYSPVTIKCSRCGHVIHDWRYSECKYCPNCGAKMDGGDEHG